jgi:hypothetical protein
LKFSQQCCVSMCSEMCHCVSLCWVGPDISNKCKVQCTLAQALRLYTGRMAHRGSRGIALPFLDHGTRRGWGISVTPQPLFTPGKDPVPIVQEAGWAPGPVWTGAENLTPTGIRSPDRPARSQSLYGLSYPAQMYKVERNIKYHLNFFRHNYFTFRNDSNGACSRGEESCVASQCILSSWDYEERPLKKCFGLLTRGENWRGLPDECLCFGSETSRVHDWLHQTVEVNGTYR